MKKIFGYVISTLGVFALIGSLSPFDVYALIGGSMYLYAGYLILDFIKRYES